MGQVKALGFEIANMLFGQGMTVESVVDILYNQTFDYDGETVQPDREWLKEQVLAVKNNRRAWGYGYNWEKQKRKR